MSSTDSYVSDTRMYVSYTRVSVSNLHASVCNTRVSVSNTDSGAALQVAVLELLAALCVGSPPNPQLFASSFLSVGDVVKNITRLHFRASDNLEIALPHSAFKCTPQPSSLLSSQVLEGP